MTRVRRERRREAKRQSRAARSVEVALALSQPPEVFFANAAAYRLSRERLEEIISGFVASPFPPEPP